MTWFEGNKYIIHRAFAGRERKKEKVKETNKKVCVVILPWLFGKTNS